MELFLAREFDAKKMSVAELRVYTYTALRYHTHVQMRIRRDRVTQPCHHQNGRAGPIDRIADPNNRVDMPKSEKYPNNVTLWESLFTQPALKP